MQPKTTQELKDRLRGYTGTTMYHRNGFCLPHTDGIAALIEEAQCHWWISDMSVVIKMTPRLRNNCFLVLKLVVKEGQAVATITDGNHKGLYTQRYSITDFPEGEFSVWVESGIILLTSEH